MKNFLFILIFSFLVSCGQNNQTQTSIETKDTTKVENLIDYKVLNIDSNSVFELNNLAKFIAGTSVSENFRLYKFTKNKSWINYTKQADATWNHFFDKNKVVVSWADTNLKNRDKYKTILYPFSGPDVLFPEMFYPQSNDVYMIGLESIGSIPKFDEKKNIPLDLIFEKYKLAINEVIKFSFFMTKQMKIELANEDINGTTPIIMLFLIRSGKTILKVEPVTIADNGTVQPVESFEATKKLLNKGVRIYYSNPNSNQYRRVTYFSTNLANDVFNKNKPLLALFDTIQGGVASYIKSASYLMHKSYFSTIRNKLITKSQLHLQDDSGIPYKFIDKKLWDVTLYGSYTTPIPLFALCYEEDLAKAYLVAKPKPLNFRIGYHPKSNLLIAKKKNL